MALRVHLDTDLGTNVDDLAALAMLLGTPGVGVAGITTCADPNGGRRALVERALQIAGRQEIVVAAGAQGVLGGAGPRLALQDARYWPNGPPATPSPAGDALDLLEANAVADATIIAVGPYTNLALLESLKPGVFANAPVVVMGGRTGALPPGMPPWQPSRDYNVQADRVAARIVFERLDPLIVPLNATVQAWLREAHLRRLRAGGPLAQLLARQAVLYAEEQGTAQFAAANDALPDDLLLFQHDSLACAAALGWDCVEASDVPLALGERDGALHFRFEQGARKRRVVTGVDAQAFAGQWLTAAERV